MKLDEIQKTAARLKYIPMDPELLMEYIAEKVFRRSKPQLVSVLQPARVSTKEHGARA